MSDGLTSRMKGQRGEREAAGGEMKKRTVISQGKSSFTGQSLPTCTYIATVDCAEWNKRNNKWYRRLWRKVKP
jgi:hypothetical protein